MALSISPVSKPLIQPRNFDEVFSAEVMVIFSRFANISDLFSWVRVNKKWRNLANNNWFWRRLVFLRYNLTLPSLPHKLLWQDIYRFGFVQTALDQPLGDQTSLCHNDWEITAKDMTVTIKNGNDEPSSITSRSNIFTMAIDGSFLFLVSVARSSYTSVTGNLVPFDKFTGIEQWNYQTKELVKVLPFSGEVQRHLDEARGMGIQVYGDLFITCRKDKTIIVDQISKTDGKTRIRGMFDPGILRHFPDATGVEMAGKYTFFRNSGFHTFPLQKNESVLLFHNDLIFLRTTFDDGKGNSVVHINVRKYGYDGLLTMIPDVIEKGKKQYKPHVFGEIVAICKNPPQPTIAPSKWQKFKALF